MILYPFFITVFFRTFLSPITYDLTTTMVGTRKTPGATTTVALDRSPGLDAVDDDFDEDLTDITDQFSVSFLLRQSFLHANCLGPGHNISLGRQYH